ncbi:MAG: STT3 domain-containing protein [archaeon]
MKEKTHDDGEDSTEELSTILSRVRTFSSKCISHTSRKMRTGLLLTLLVLIPVLLTIVIRLQPQALPITDDWARNAVNNYYRNAIDQQVTAQYPHLPPQNRQSLVDQQFNEFLKTNAANVEEQVRQTSAQFKTGFQYEENNHTYTYLGDLDSYFYLRDARNILEKGVVCDTYKDGVCWDNHQFAPIGNAAQASMHPYGIVVLYKVLHVFMPSINLMQASFLLPAVIACIAAIAAFFIGRRLMNNTAGFFAAMFLALSPMFISRTLGSDTDVWNVMFPLLIMWLFIEGFEAKTTLKRYTFISLAGLATGFFSFAWVSGWWYIFLLIIGLLLAYLVFKAAQLFVHHKRIQSLFNADVKTGVLIFITFIASVAVFVSLIGGSAHQFLFAFQAPLQLATGLKAAAHANLWPNIYTTVAELNEASIQDVVMQVSFGYRLFFSVAMLGMLVMLLRKKLDMKQYLLLGMGAILALLLVSNWAWGLSAYAYMALLIAPVLIALFFLLKEKEDIDVKPALLLVMWFAAMIFASIKGVRFILLLIPAFSLAAGVAFGYAYHHIVRIFGNASWKRILVFLVLALVLFVPFKAGLAAGRGFVPNMNDGWWDSLTKIRTESAPDAIINSWWDFGHWFKFVSDRKVTLDGGTQNHPNAHWLGKLMLTSSEEESVAILRMLDCGSNNAFEEVNKRMQDTEKSVNIIDAIILMDKDDARQELVKQGFTSDEIATILARTHCTPPEDYFITSEDMVGKAGVWAHFGAWDFDRAYIANNVKGTAPTVGIPMIQSRFNYTEDEAKRLYYEVQALVNERAVNDWIAPWPNYITGRWATCTNKSTTNISCPVNIGVGQNELQTIVLERVDVNAMRPNETKLIFAFYDRRTNFKTGETTGQPTGVVIAGEEKLTRYDLNGTFDADVLLAKSNDQFLALLSNKRLTESTFTKLFYLEGAYTKHFEKFSDVFDPTGSRIIVWKVNWQGKNESTN